VTDNDDNEEGLRTEYTVVPSIVCSNTDYREDNIGGYHVLRC
jgi:hypothetical protein